MSTEPDHEAALRLAAAAVLLDRPSNLISDTDRREAAVAMIDEARQWLEGGA